MEISYGGGASFLLKDERTVTINPERQAEKADIAVYSTRKAWKRLIVDGPGEYEIGGVLIRTIQLAERLAHSIAVGGLNVVFLDAVPANLGPEDVEPLGRTDVLVVRTDDLPAAQGAIRELLPRVVVPFGAGVEEACAALGVTDSKPAVRWAWNGSGTPPKVVRLKAPGAKRRRAA